MELSRRQLLQLTATATASFIASPLLSIESAKAVSATFTSLSDLQSAIKTAANGDIFQIADGTYTDVKLDVSTAGVTIKAQNPGAVIFTGSSHISINSDNCIFQGIQFRDGNSSGIVIRVLGSNNLIQDLNFKNYSAKKYINLEAGSQHNEISYCNFEGKPVDAPQGNLVGVIPDPNIVGYHRIRFCSFKNNLGKGGDNGNEPIRLGDGAYSTMISRTVIEYCYWENTGLGDSENISIKCKENVVRHCTFTNNQDGMLVFRNGDSNMAYGNSFINAGGIRVKEANDIYCFNNYFENSGLGGRSDAITLQYLNDNLKGIHFSFNTFINCGAVNLGGNGPTDNTWANNLFVKAAGPILQSPNTGTTWIGNTYLGDLGLPTPAGIKKLDPLLVRSADGYMRPQLKSPIRAKAVPITSLSIYAGLLPTNPMIYDLTEKLRPTKPSQWDLGAIQYQAKPVLHPSLTAKTTGPRYKYI